MFQPVDANVSFPEIEREILTFWRQADIYNKSLAARAQGPSFVFFEGPPTANGKPHPGHCLTRAMKDLFPRYRTMRGDRCLRKAGWDTHGLPVEVEVCKELGIHSKEEIEAFGVEPFIHRCQQSVWQYMRQWEELTERIGFWIHLDEAYVTYHQSYVESVWWSLKTLFERGLLYQGHKIVWWWAQGGTALSSGEVGQGYRSVADPSVYVLFPLVDRPDTSLLIWTTTPWTLPSNQFAAVHPDIEYATVIDQQMQQRIILAACLVDEIAAKVKRELPVVSTCPGRELVGLRYRPPFDFFYCQDGERVGQLRAGGQEHIAWRITAADFVTTDSGTGAVHEAPAFGEVDFDLLQREQARFVAGQGPELICAVNPNGKMTADTGEFAGLWVKDADKPIIRRLKESGRLYHQEVYQHEYPFCWRSQEDPLIQYPRRSWFIRTTAFREAMLANNAQINWLPDHIRDGRFGNFLESNVDWALSRERYWGTPLPIWVCDRTGDMEAVASFRELMDKPGVAGCEVWENAKRQHPDLPDDLKVHKPYIDEITYQSPFDPAGRMRRVPEVIDCWYDSGAMPFAQWGYPHQGRDAFDDQFPAAFISEAIDQTRGWFYSLVAISTMLFGEGQTASARTFAYPHPFANCIVLGLMLAESNVCVKCGHRQLEEAATCPACGSKMERKVEKMSKQLRNYREPQEIFDRYGADALRWYFFSAQPPWNSVIYSERAIKDVIPEFLLRLWNVYGFFVLYANLDGFAPGTEVAGPVQDLSPTTLARGKSNRPVAHRSELDRWILAELHQTVARVVQRMDAYDNFVAASTLSGFVDALSNWYVRRSRDRFWSADKSDQDKLDAYWTLYECLLTTARMMAPFVPFTAEAIWQNLARAPFGERATESVHLCAYPESDSALRDDQLTERMGLLREIASLGRSARVEARLKVRQPLSGMTVVLNSEEHLAWLADHSNILQDELNVKSVDFQSRASDLANYTVQPNYKRLGPQVGKLLPRLKEALQRADAAELLNQLQHDQKVRIDLATDVVELSAEDIQVRLVAKPGWAAAQGPHCVVILATELTPELIDEGLAQDVKRLVQDYRKQRKLDFADRIHLLLWTSDNSLRSAVERHTEFLKSETLALEIEWRNSERPSALVATVGDATIRIDLDVVSTPDAVSAMGV